MSALKLFKKPTPKEQLRSGQRAIGRDVRDLERELVALKREEAKLTKEIKEAAAKGNTAGARILARNLVRLRGQQTKLLQAAAGLRGVSAGMATAAATASVGQSLGSASKVMARMGEQQDLKAMHKTAAGFARESQRMDMAGEMMDGALEDALGEGVEEESDEVMAQVLDSIGLDLSAQLAAAPRARAPAPAAARQQDQEQQQGEEADLLARLAALK